MRGTVFHAYGFFCFKQKTAYEMRISDWSSDVCSSDLSAYQVVSPTFAAVPTRLICPGASTMLPEVGASGVYAVPGAAVALATSSPVTQVRSEERRVGKVCVRTCRSRWSPYPSNKTYTRHRF